MALRHLDRPRTRAQIRGRPHAARPPAGSASDPARVLAERPLGHADWKAVLKALLALNVRRHALKQKDVSNATAYERERFLFAFFAELRASTPYCRVDPRGLGNRHVAAMVRVWNERGHSAKTIANSLSKLRAFMTWIGKESGVVRSLPAYLGADYPRAYSRQAAAYDHSWVARGVAFADVRAQLERECPYVAMQTEFSRLFGARPKETWCVAPHEAVVPSANADPRDVAPGCDATHYLGLLKGTKGGRPRYVPITSDEQRRLIERACAVVPAGAYLGRPGRTLLANAKHYYRTLAKVGITRSARKVTAYGLRHEFANDRYEQAAGVASPVRGGSCADRSLDREARAIVARQLGHNRPQVVSCYVGSPKRPASPTGPETAEIA